MSKIYISLLLILVIGINTRLAFLEENTTQVSEINPQSLSEFISGFEKGFGLYYNLPHFEACHANDQKVRKSFAIIVDLLSQFNRQHDPSWVDLGLKILSNAVDIVHDTWELRGVCHELYDVEYPEETKKILVYLHDPEFLKKFAVHSLDQINIIRDQVVEIITIWRNGAYEAAGEKFGKMVISTVFFELK
jgi:hypothetical protein